MNFYHCGLSSYEHCDVCRIVLCVLTENDIIVLSCVKIREVQI